MVQSVKRPFYKTLNGKILTETELYTILTDIESAINNRPLTVISESYDDNNLLPITPAHRILGKSLKQLPNNLHTGIENVSREKMVKLRWKERQKLADYYWKIWNWSPELGDLSIHTLNGLNGLFPLQGCHVITCHEMS